MILQSDFYLRNNVTDVARDLLGKKLVTRINGSLTAGIIVETEAYEGVSDKASHAYGGRFTERTRIMYSQGGISYVYLCYGIHHLFNVVTNTEGIPHAVLIRAIEPVEGIATMLKRRKKEKLTPLLCAGPGAMSEALGIRTTDTGILLTGKRIWIEDEGIVLPRKEIIASPRVGVAYAQEDASRPYRFRISNNPYTSKAK